MLLHYAQLVFPQLEDIKVVRDLNTGSFITVVGVAGNGTLKLPLHSLSDGTIKWLALMAILISTGGAYSVEEPENFLHPNMQSVLIDIVRDNVNSNIRPNYFIMSTHSETLLNRCKPDEIILFSFDDGQTKCRRISDPKLLSETIKKSKFGLGYFYASNAIE